MIELTTATLKKYDLPVSEKKIAVLCEYYSILIEYQNVRHINLTGIIEPRDFIIKNIVDTALLMRHINLTDRKIIDLGSGNGIPGLLIAVLFPESEVTLVDSVKKKVGFLNYATTALRLKNCAAVAERIELLAKKKEYFEVYDLALGRALADLAGFAELSAPFIKTGGYIIAQKSRKISEELETATGTLEFCGFELKERCEYEIEGNCRIILKYLKTHATPSILPRGVGDYARKTLRPRI